LCQEVRYEPPRVCRRAVSVSAVSVPGSPC
jgi:hypothetical protein